MTDLEKLAERCEQATGPDAALDGAIWLGVKADAVSRNAYDEGLKLSRGESAFRLSYMSDGFRPTASLDAAMTLVPEECSAVVWTAGPRGFTTGPAARVFHYSKDDDSEGGYAIGSFSPHEIAASTPALALCAAALRARAASVDRSPKGQDAEERLDRNDESAVPQADAPKQSLRNERNHREARAAEQAPGDNS